MALNNKDTNAIMAWFESRGLLLDPRLLQKITLYHDLIHFWSKRVNLVSKKDLGKIIESHFLDSLGPLNMLPSEGDLIDIGSGSGFPGIPLALILPRLEVTLLESVHKKVLFLREAKATLGLQNARIIEGRPEDLSPSEVYDVAVIRALPKWETYLSRIKKHLKPEGKIIYYRFRGAYEKIDK
jgi:16S rRNA (guanine527-N7)-methyltransferase